MMAGGARADHRHSELISVCLCAVMHCVWNTCPVQRRKPVVDMQERRECLIAAEALDVPTRRYMAKSPLAVHSRAFATHDTAIADIHWVRFFLAPFFVVICAPPGHAKTQAMEKTMPRTHGRSWGKAGHADPQNKTKSGFGAKTNF